MAGISALTTDFNAYIEEKINNKTKPLGALGQLELLAAQFAKIQYQQHQNTNAPLKISQSSLLVFAGDHGIASEGVSIAPSEVTGQMVANFAHGGAAINVFCQQFNWQLKVVDAGILHAPEPELGIISQRLGATTQAFHQTAAMSLATVNQGFTYAEQLISQIKAQGTNLIAFGEMGIGNTSAASAIMSILMNLPASETVGKGTGVSDEIVTKKQQLIEQAINLHSESLEKAKAVSPEHYVKQILACVGGFEIVQLTAAMLASAKENMMIVVDGFICTAAAMLAVTLEPKVKDYMVFAHSSGEQGHQKMLTWLEVTPLLNLGLRLGEGSGAALALPLIQAAVAFYNDMASFSQAEVTDVVTEEAN